MKLKKWLPVLSIAFLMGCSQSKTKTAGDVTALTFSDYLKTLDTIPLPIWHSCSDFPFPDMSLHFDSAGFKKYGDRNCAKPFGILLNNNQNVVTIDLSNGDDCLVPFLSSFDETGHKLDSLDLYQKAYDDTASAVVPYFRIARDKRIVVIDTTKNWKNDQSSNMIPGSETIAIDSTIYYLSDKGKFTKAPPN